MVNLVIRAWALDQRNFVSFLSVLLDVWFWVSYGKLIGPSFPSLWNRDHNTCDAKIILGSKWGKLWEITLKLSGASEPCTWNCFCLRRPSWSSLLLANPSSLRTLPMYHLLACASLGDILYLSNLCFVCIRQIRCVGIYTLRLQATHWIVAPDLYLGPYLFMVLVFISLHRNKP